MSCPCLQVSNCPVYCSKFCHFGQKQAVTVCFFYRRLAILAAGLGGVILFFHKPITKKHFLIIKDSGNIFKIKFPEIIYIETYNRNILFHLTSGSEITGHESLKAYEDKLDERFYRCHTGYIVNMAYVTSIQKDCAILNSNITVPVSRYKKKNFQMLNLS